MSRMATATPLSFAYQTRDMVEAMNRDSGIELTSLTVDGGIILFHLLFEDSINNFGWSWRIILLSGSFALQCRFFFPHRRLPLKARSGSVVLYGPVADLVSRRFLFRPFCSSSQAQVDWTGRFAVFVEFLKPDQLFGKVQN